MTTQIISLSTEYIEYVQNEHIEPYQSVALQTWPDYGSVTSTSSIPDLDVLLNIQPNSIISATSIGNIQQLDRYIDDINDVLDPTIPSQLQFGVTTVNYLGYIYLQVNYINDVSSLQIDVLASTLISNADGYYSIVEQQTFGDFTYVPIISPSAVSSNVLYGTHTLDQTVINLTYQNSISFGTSSINMEIDDPDDGTQLLPVLSSISFGTMVVGKTLVALSVNPTGAFGLPSFGDFIHRMLVFKNDNIAKIGATDSVEVAHGMVFNPYTRNTTTASTGIHSLPANPAGFITVTINGTDYKIPYYND